MQRLGFSLPGGILLAAAPVLAQDAGSDHSVMDHGNGTAMDAPSTKAFMAAMEGMRNGRSMDMTGDPDLDFLKGMIPHNEGAIAMAKVELEHGRDERAKDLARRIIADQEAEIVLMRRMIAEREGATR